MADGSGSDGEREVYMPPAHRPGHTRKIKTVPTVVKESVLTEYLQDLEIKPTTPTVRPLTHTDANTGHGVDQGGQHNAVAQQLATAQALERRLQSYFDFGVEANKAAITSAADGGGAESDDGFEDAVVASVRQHHRQHSRPHSTTPTRALATAHVGERRATSAASAPRPRSAATARVRLYDERPHVTTLTAFRNGELTRGVVVTASGLARMLEECTVKLRLPFAARRLYDVGGSLIATDLDLAMLERGCAVFVARGDAFRTPGPGSALSPVCHSTLSWTVGGVAAGLVRPQSASLPLTAVPCPAPAAPLPAVVPTRVMVLRNGRGDGGRWLVGQRRDAFLAAATSKLDLPAAKRCFSVDGTEVDVATLPLCEEALWPLFGGRCAAPLWVSVGEGFNSEGAALLVRSLQEQIKAEMAAANNCWERVQNFQRSGDWASAMVEDQTHTTALARWRAARTVLQAWLDAANALRQPNVSNNGAFAHIPKISDTHRLVSSVYALKFRVRRPGNALEETVTFSSQTAARGTGDHGMQSFVDECCDRFSLSRNRSGSRVVLTNGLPVTDLSLLPRDSLLCLVQTGEVFAAPILACLGVNLVACAVTADGATRRLVALPPLSAGAPLALADTDAEVWCARAPDSLTTTCATVVCCGSCGVSPPHATGEASCVPCDTPLIDLDASSALIGRVAHDEHAAMWYPTATVTSPSDVAFASWCLMPVATNTTHCVTIVTATGPALALAANAVEPSRVCLVKPSIDDIRQQWRLGSRGTICLNADPQRALTAQPCRAGDGSLSWTIVLAPLLGSGSPLVSAQQWALRAVGPESSRGDDARWGGHLRWPFSATTDAFAGVATLVCGVTFPVHVKPPRMAVGPQISEGHVDIRVARLGDPTGDRGIASVRLPRASSLGTVLDSASTALSLPAPAKRLFTVFGECVDGEPTAAWSIVVDNATATSAVLAPIVAQLSHGPGAVYFLGSASERFQVPSTSGSRTAWRDLSVAVQTLQSDVAKVEATVMKIDTERERGGDFVSVALGACRQFGVCTAVIFGAAQTVQWQAPSSIDAAPLCLPCRVQDGLMDPADAVWPQAEFTCRQFLPAVDDWKLTDVSVPLACRLQLSLLDQHLNNTTMQRFARTVARLQALLEPPTAVKPAAPTPSLEPERPWRFLLFPEGLFDRKYAGLVVVPTRVGATNLLAVLLREAASRLSLAQPATMLVTRDGTRVSEPAMCRADNGQVPELWVLTRSVVAATPKGCAPVFTSAGTRLCTARKMIILMARRNGDDSGPVYEIRGQTLEQLLDAVATQSSAPAKRFFVDTPAARGALVVDMLDGIPAGLALFAHYSRGPLLTDGRVMVEDIRETTAQHEAAFVQRQQLLFMAPAASRPLEGVHDVPCAHDVPVVDFRWLSRGHLVGVSRGEAYVDAADLRRRRAEASAASARAVTIAAEKASAKLSTITRSAATPPIPLARPHSAGAAVVRVLSSPVVPTPRPLAATARPMSAKRAK